MQNGSVCLLNLINECSTPPDRSNPHALLSAHIADLIRIKWEHRFGECDSLYLKELEYVYGEQSGAKYYMRFHVLVGEAPEAAVDDVTFGLQLVVSEPRVGRIRNVR